jgi:6-phosphogluconolactonase/glucosamine-6-phosphate isomerase/deaminase
MLMIDLDRNETMFLPMKDGREVRVENSSSPDDPNRSITITIPAVAETDQILLTIAGRGHSIQGAVQKSKRTRLALHLPDDCQIRYSHRERQPRKAASRV